MKPQTIQFLANMGVFSSLIFIPVYAKELGASDFEIGLIAVAFATALLASSYIFGREADIRGRRRIIQLGLVLSGFAALTQIVTTEWYFLMLSRVLVGFCMGIFPSALLAYAFESGRRLGKFASFGSLGWGIGSVIAGIIGVFSHIFLFSSLIFFACFALALTLPSVAEVRLSIPFFPVHIIKKNASVYLSVLLRHSGANMIWVIFPLFLLSLGMDKSMVGVLYLANAGTQFSVMQLIDRFNSVKLVLGGLMFSAVTFMSFTLAGNFVEILPTQILLGVSFALMYVGSLRFLMEKNIERATSTGMLQSVMSISAIIGPFFGGLISMAFGYHATMYAATIMTLIAIATFLPGIRQRINEQTAPSDPSQG
ncbi:MAG: MFS transporter [Thermoplasmata archaeon]